MSQEVATLEMICAALSAATPLYPPGQAVVTSRSSVSKVASARQSVPSSPVWQPALVCSMKSATPWAVMVVES